MSAATSRRILALVAICGVCVSSAPSRAQSLTVTTCDAANPFDNLPDDAALQACLNNFDVVLLQPADQPGYAGYLLSDTIRFKKTGGALTSAKRPVKATMLAAPGLTASMLRASGVDNFEISYVRFDGNRENRLVRDKPCDATHDFGNVELTGTGFHIRAVESNGAVCGSAMTIGGSSGFEIADSMFYDNGRQPEEANGIQGLWSDGLTVFGCRNSTIRDNAFWDNTDVDLGVNGGEACSVYRNTVGHFQKYAFAGIVAGDPTRSGGEFSDNQVTSGLNLLGFGIIAGCHPWAQCQGGYATGINVYRNTITGAVVNLAIDGLNGGSAHDNVMSGARGTRLINCPGPSADYVVGHEINVSPLQTGYAVRILDAGTPCDPAFSAVPQKNDRTDPASSPIRPADHPSSAPTRREARSTAKSPG